ncbi:piggyBac transposable element-derived protein 4-like [Ischnura elegans]|uniref:piggyBac transposable element-derived protein 4-like n=1 Tax=Ischnura elegans TaxID=197161 RepID=UPI001ED8AE7A|nr:piggyBac transposable element-derived protein 4-like [Ischnura elegans]
MKAFIGLLILSGSIRSGHQNIRDLWDRDGFGIEIFYTTMSMKRFLFLLRCVRFDDVKDRPQRREHDKFTAFRNVFETFTSNCEKYYNLGELTTIDEQLVPFRGKCPFRQFIPSKPIKYGIKVFTLTDARSMYTKTMEVYLGTQPEGPFRLSNRPCDVVKRLAKTMAGTGRNITADNWFSSIPLVQDLLEKRITYLGTMRKNKVEIPPELSNAKQRAVGTSIFAFQKHLTLLSYIPKKIQNVIMISSMHRDASIDDRSGEMRKPEIITDYNYTKSGVDTVDEMCATYSTARRCKRWPLVMFFRILNIAGINAQVIYMSNNAERKLVRRLFLREVGRELVHAQIRKRATCNSVPRSLREKVLKLSGSTSSGHSEFDVKIRARCTICPRNMDKKTNQFCSRCSKTMCLKHMKTVCPHCFDHLNENNK